MPIDFEALGYAAFPGSRGYPTRDKYTAKNEADFIRGWNRAKFEDTIAMYSVTGYNPNSEGYMRKHLS